MIGRILCIGTGHKLTSPGASAQGYESGRKYEYPAPGTVHYYKSQGEHVVLEKSVCDMRYGLVVIDDFLISEIKPSIEAPVFGEPHQFIHSHHEGIERARDLANQWRNYGAVLIAGPVPTEQEIEDGRKLRKDYVENRLTEVKTGQMLRRQGHEGYKPGYDVSDREWAREFGVILPDTMETLERDVSQRRRDLEIQQEECPFCFNLIDSRARKCQHCHEMFQGMTVAEFLNKDEEKSAVSVHRGPGRPRKEPVAAQ